jgi:hypothetical protein
MWHLMDVLASAPGNATRGVKDRKLGPLANSSLRSGGTVRFTKGCNGLSLLCQVLQLRDGSERSFCNRWTADQIGHGQNKFLDFGRKAQQSHDLGYPGAGDPLPSGDLRLVPNLTGVELPPPFLGRPEKLDHLRCLGSLGRLPVPGLRREGVDGLVRRHTSFQGAHDPGLERTLGPQGDFHRLFAVGGHRGPIRALLGDMDDPEPDLGPGPSGPAAASRTVTFGEPVVWVAERLMM